MSATVSLLIDLGALDLRALPEDSPEWTRLRDSYLRCVRRLGIKCMSQPVKRIDVEGFPLVEIDGPWNAVCQVGASTMKLGFGVKWEVFVTDSNERTACLQEAICLARACGALQMVGFANEGYGSHAYEQALTGASFAAVLQELHSIARRVEATVAKDVSVRVLSDRLGAVGERLGAGFFLITLQPESR